MRREVGEANNPSGNDSHILESSFGELISAQPTIPASPLNSIFLLNLFL